MKKFTIFTSVYLKIHKLETLDIMQLKGKELLEYQRYIERRRDEKSFAITKELELQEAREKGKEEGRKEGIEKGKKERDIEIAKTSLKQGIDINTISIITGLTIQEIKELKD